VGLRFGDGSSERINVQFEVRLAGSRGIKLAEGGLTSSGGDGSNHGDGDDRGDAVLVLAVVWW
jgi:hypothetical protein